MHDDVVSGVAGGLGQGCADTAASSRDQRPAAIAHNRRSPSVQAAEFVMVERRQGGDEDEDGDNGLNLHGLAILGPDRPALSAPVTAGKRARHTPDTRQTLSHSMRSG